MLGTRVTQQILTDRTLFNLNKHTSSLMDLQEQLSSGQRINRPSDDPLAARRAISARLESSQNDQYLTNISTLRPYLEETDTTLTGMVEIVQRAKELALQGASTTNGQVQRDNIAMEIDELLKSTVQQGNHVTNGRYIFAGTNTQTIPFATTTNAAGDITGVTYNGNDDNYTIEISKGVRVNANVTGTEAFLPTTSGTVDIFQTLIDIRDNLRSGNVNGLTGNLDTLDAAQTQLLSAQSKAGSIENRLDRTETALEEIGTQMQQIISDNIDADFAEVLTKLNAESNAYQASLNATARVIQPSLLDYLG